jgi:hypothetical protein
VNLQENIRRILREIEEDKIQIRLGRSAERHFGKVQNIIIMVDDQDITSEDDVPGLGKMNIVIKDNEIIVGDIFIPEKYRKQGIATIVYQKISDYFNLPIVNSKTKGFNQTIEGGHIWKKRERFEPKNLQEHIKRILQEDVEEKSSRKIKLQNLVDELGIELASNAVGGFDNLVKMLNLDLGDIKTQEMLVKNFINYAELAGIDILFLEINTNKPDKVRIKIHFDTNIYDSNVDSWVTRTMSDEINKFFPFKSSPYWEPSFAGRGVTIVLDSEQIIKEDDEDEMDLQETELTEKCWKGYTQKGMKTMFGKRYPNCVKIKK